jgi:hypothetical protein
VTLAELASRRPLFFHASPTPNRDLSFICCVWSEGYEVLRDCVSSFWLQYPVFCIPCTVYRVLCTLYGGAIAKASQCQAYLVLCTHGRFKLSPPFDTGLSLGARFQWGSALGSFV